MSERKLFSIETLRAVLGLGMIQKHAAEHSPGVRATDPHHNGPVGHGKSRTRNNSQHSRANRRKAKRAARVRGRG